jgi:preprotein translocase subunit SecD
MRPARYFAVFALIVAALYTLVFLTGNGKPTPKLGIDLQGGTQVTLTARTTNGKPPSQASLNQARQIIETRVDGMGISGSQVTQDGSNLVITVPGAGGQQAKELGQTAVLNIRKVVPNEVMAAGPSKPVPPPSNLQAAIAQAKATRQSTNPAVQMQALRALNCRAEDPLEGNDDPNLPLVACNQQGTEKYVMEPAVLPGRDIQTATATPPNPSQGQPGWTVNVQFKNNGPQIWSNFTAQNVNQQAAFVLDTQVVSAPSINGPIPGGSTTISGSFTQQSATNLANILKYGSLPLAFDQSTAQTVSPTLGLISLQAGLIAGGIGLVLVAVYCLFYYRALGVLTILSLALSGLMIFAVLVLLGRWVDYTLDLAGIAGFIVAIGITADSFVIFFERIKDEVREGRTFRSAVPRAWTRARRTILSSDAVSFLAAAVLYIIAVGDVQGFAFTLGMSTVLDLVVVFFVTHPLVAMASRNRLLSKPSVSGLGAVQRLGSQRRAARTRSTRGSTTVQEGGVR